MLLLSSSLCHAQNWNKGVWNADKDDGTYTNPILHSDYSDPDVCRVGNDFYLTASSFNCVPGLPILHSNDLVNWQLIGYALPELYDESFNQPQHGNGVWAPAIRFHNNEFYIYWGDPDLGIYMVKAKDPAGPWSKPHLVHKAKGWIDPCPFWDDDGKAYLVHAFAGSRAGIKSILVMNEMSPDGMNINPQTVLVFDGHENHPTIEGPKLYKRNAYYYIFAPAGGVKPGWQTVLRSKNIYGPYEEKIVLHQGNTPINGPHQGGWVELESGESWFIHFQDKDAYGRIVHLQPVKWINDWPLMGIDSNNDGIGEPVLTHQKPKVNIPGDKLVVPTSDEFNTSRLGLQWQWHANPKAEWAFPNNMGFLRLNTVQQPLAKLNFWDLPNLLLQKLPAETFTTTTKFTFYPKENGEKTGLIVMGEDYAYLALEFSHNKSYVTFQTCTDARTGGKELQEEKVEVENNELYFRVRVNEGGICQFAYSTDGQQFTNIGKTFTSRAGRWIGAKVGIFALKEQSTNDSGYADYDWFRFE
ncbi:MAG: glycoside hydrolase 43 family protein [Prolixibacteraceae bacterium]|nr:glycoside hydrolase 43 family protein [Prolixibacteraceae bacterium]